MAADDGPATLRAYTDATREIMRVVARSRHDEQPVFEAILKAAATLCGSPNAALVLVDESQENLIYTAGWGEQYKEIEIGTKFPLSAPNVVHTSVREARVVQEADLPNTDLYRQGDPLRRQLVDREGIRTLLGVPLISGGRAIGAISLRKAEPVPFAPNQVALLETFADQAVIAIENARQFRELQTRLEHEAATRELLSVISQSRDDETPVFDFILENAARLCPSPMARLYLVEAERTHFAVAANWGENVPSIEPSFRMPLDSTSNLAKAINQGSTVHIADIRENAASPVQVQLAQREGLRTQLTVPLLKDGIAIGCLTLSRREVLPYEDEHIALLETFAAQAVIAIENVRQFRELQTRLEREAATREILSVISQSRDDETPVFDVIVEHAARLCHASRGDLLIASEDKTQYALAASYGDEFGGASFTEMRPLDPERLSARALLENRIYHLHDVREGEAYKAGHPIARTIADVGGIRTILFVPLTVGGEAVGTIGLSRKEVAPFSDDEIALVQSFAAQAVIAIENARQFRELQTRLEREAASKEILHVISRSRDDEQPVFDTILERAARLCGAPMAWLVLVDESRSVFIDTAFHGEEVRSWTLGQQHALEPPSLIAQTILDARTANIADLAETDQYRQGLPNTVRLVEEEGLRSRLYVPLLNGEEAIGCILLSRREVRPFTIADAALVETFAAQAVIAIENVRQFRELQTRLEREAATREILSVISQHQDDEQPVFDVLLESAAKLCGSPNALLSLVDDAREYYVPRAISGDPYKTFRIGTKISLSRDSVGAVAIREVRVVHENLTNTDLYAERDDYYHRLYDGEGVRILLAVPLVSGGRAIGAISLRRFEEKPFSSDQIALLETFAAQAVIAIENVRQFRELQTRLEREAANREILQVISGSRADERPVFDTILESSRRLCRVDMCLLAMMQEDSDTMVLAAYAGKKLSVFEVGVSSVPLDSQQNTALAVRENRTIHTEDMREEELYRAGDSIRRIVVDDEGMRTQLVIPLRSGDTAIGSFVLYRQRVERFAEREITLLETFAAQAVIAIENVRQFRALEALNTELGDRVEEQVGEIERMGRLKRFLSPAVADAVVSSGDENILSSHRALIGILFCDIRGFTAFCETAEPEETIEFLQTYHEEMGKLINAHGAGVDHRWGDGIMVIFNDPFPCDDPAGDALRLALAMREKMAEICQRWKRLGHRLGFGVGVSLGYATVGMVGSEGRFDYTANGSAVNMAARLCDHAEDGEILLSPRAYTAVEDDFEAESTGEMTFKGIRQPTEVFRVVGPRGG